jgi:hypothetical protein
MKRAIYRIYEASARVKSYFSVFFDVLRGKKRNPICGSCAIQCGFTEKRKNISALDKNKCYALFG